ncbi:hypothetical protein HHL16_18940 [Pseudoflavitalea sp. G-6-1-2]|uniref:MauE/DoxX family redox-associated membrane protein n=1 Tax=Pseudoflavitalea sp. G-6-1-2 TaxID=2728841 RepID=UPI00146C41FD|nr:MauE/DoxX family redox-associated membrane protein [Pseudoflavitalea sp. G-6-1-2]NML22961.1 hypothetical protein [Pseudoflavitalea sp. G-6-1-2]
MIKKAFVRGTSLLLVVLFLYASLSKLSDYGKFRTNIAESPFIGRFAGVLAWFIPAAEIYISIMLLFAVTRLNGLYASFVLMLAFSVYIALLLGSGSEVPCECGGILNEMSWETHLVFNCVFTALSGSAALLERRRLRQVRPAA